MRLVARLQERQDVGILPGAVDGRAGLRLPLLVIPFGVAAVGGPCHDDAFHAVVAEERGLVRPDALGIAQHLLRTAVVPILRIQLQKSLFPVAAVLVIELLQSDDAEDGGAHVVDGLRGVHGDVGGTGYRFAGGVDLGTAHSQHGAVGGGVLQHAGPAFAGLRPRVPAAGDPLVLAVGHFTEARTEHAVEGHDLALAVGALERQRRHRIPGRTLLVRGQQRRTREVQSLERRGRVGDPPRVGACVLERIRVRVRVRQNRRQRQRLHRAAALEAQGRLRPHDVNQPAAVLGKLHQRGLRARRHLPERHIADGDDIESSRIAGRLQLAHEVVGLFNFERDGARRGLLHAPADRRGAVLRPHAVVAGAKQRLDLRLCGQREECHAGG